jgi:hypothetical protein
LELPLAPTLPLAFALFPHSAPYPVCMVVVWCCIVLYSICAVSYAAVEEAVRVV